MDFLSTIMSFPSIIANLKGSTSDPYKKQKKNIMAAMSDINNPLYQQLYGQYKTQNRQNVSESISELEKQQRKQRILGRSGVDNERASESAFRNLMRGGQAADVLARQQTMGNLQQQLANYGGATHPAAQANLQRLYGYQSIGDLISNLIGKKKYGSAQF